MADNVHALPGQEKKNKEKGKTQVREYFSNVRHRKVTFFNFQLRNKVMIGDLQPNFAKAIQKQLQFQSSLHFHQK